MSGIEELEAYYQAGIGVVATKLGVPLRVLSVGYDAAVKPGLPIEPLEEGLEPRSPCDAILIEDYLTACVSGAAARFIRSEQRQRQFGRCVQGAALEVRCLREIWQGWEPESERALVVALAFLRDKDGGDAEATMYRLWHRAVRILQAPAEREQLDRLARQLLTVGSITGRKVDQFLKT
jgi:hypothetical protein